MFNLSWSHLCLLFAQRVCSSLPYRGCSPEEDDAENSNECQPSNRIRRQHSENAEDKRQPEEKKSELDAMDNQTLVFRRGSVNQRLVTNERGPAQKNPLFCPPRACDSDITPHFVANISGQRHLLAYNMSFLLIHFAATNNGDH